MNDPSARAVTFDQMKDAYRTQVRGLIDGGSDVLLYETITDTLNTKAALVATEEVFEEKGVRLPILISATITDRSGRTLSGQTVEAFWISIAHARPFSVGLNCALGAKDMAPYLEELSKAATTRISCYPNAGPAQPVRRLRRAARADLGPAATTLPRRGWVNIVGGCCGTTPEHIAAIAAAVKELPPRRRPDVGPNFSSATTAPAMPELKLRHVPGTCRTPAHPNALFGRFSGLEPLDHPAGFELPDDRRAHQRHRVGQVRAPHQGRRLRRPPSRSRSTRCAAAPTSSTSTWTRACSTPSAP